MASRIKRLYFMVYWLSKVLITIGHHHPFQVIQFVTQVDPGSLEVTFPTSKFGSRFHSSSQLPGVSDFILGDLKVAGGKTWLGNMFGTFAKHFSANPSKVLLYQGNLTGPPPPQLPRFPQEIVGLKGDEKNSMIPEVALGGGWPVRFP